MIWLGIVLTIIGIALLTAAYKQRTNQTVSGLGGVNDFEDFINNVTGSPYTSYKTNGGSILQISLANRSTLIRLHNNSATDVAGISAVDPNGSGCIVVENGTSTSIATDCSINGAVANTPETVFVFGFGETQNPIANPGTDSYLKFDRSVSNNWVAVRKDGTNTVQTITTVPVVMDPVAGGTYTFTQLKVIITLTQATYFVNGILVATINQSWAALSNPTTGPQAVLSTGASGADIENVWLDYMWLIHNFATIRPTP